MDYVRLGHATQAAVAAVQFKLDAAELKQLEEPYLARPART
jgi:hypothetical protein